MNRFLVFSDLHLHLWTYGAKILEDGKNSRLLHQQKALERMHLYAQNNSIRDIFFCGDLFHTHEIVRTEVLDAAYGSFSEMFNDSGLRLYFLIGNHDMANKMGGIHSLPFFERQNSIVIDRPVYWKSWDTNLSFSACPYTEDKSKLIRFLNDVPRGDMVFLHQGIDGVEVNSKGFTVKGEILTSALTDKLDSNHIFSGHYHSFRRVRPNLTIPGSLVQLTWNDKNESRGWLDVTLSEGDVDIKHIDSSAPRFVELTGSDLDLDQVEGNFVRVIGDRDLFDRIVKEDEAESVEFIATFDEDDQKIDEDKEFSSITDVFEEFVESRDLPDGYETVGREIVDGTYEANIPDGK